MRKTMTAESAHDYDIPVAATMDVATAFVVYETTDGVCVGAPVVASIELRDDQGNPVRIRPARQATPDDLWRGCAEVAKDVSNAQVAALVVQQMMNVSRMAMEAQRNANVADHVRKNLYVPGQ
jgi:hypothetical protein